MGDAVRIRNFEKWQNSSFSFSDGVVLSFQDVMKIVQGPVDVSSLAEKSLVGGADGSSVGVTDNSNVMEQSGGNDHSNRAAGTK
ncbi:hypothetical protein D3C84_1217160 [compost metagenome]